MEKYDKFIKNERGAVQIIEAAFVYPIVVTAAAAMIYLGMYVFETALLNDRAEEAADMAARTLVFAGLDELGDIYENLGFSCDEDLPDRKAVEKAYDRSEPYRYFVSGQADERFAEAVNEYASGMLFPTSDVKCSIEVKRRMFDREVEVKAEKYISLPGVLSLCGINNRMKITASADSVTSDPAEFIRNTDLAVRSADMLAEKTGVSGKITDIGSRISDILGKLKAGIK